MLFFGWNVTQNVCKQNIVMHHDQQHTHYFSRQLGVYFNNQTFRIFHSSWIDGRDTFMPLSIYKATGFVENQHTGKLIFC